MANIITVSESDITLKGSFEMWAVPADVPYDDVLNNLGTPILAADNLVVSSAINVLVQLLRGKYEEYLPSFISIGSGGDLSQSTKLDTGARVGAAVTDTSMRATTARIPIVTTQDGENGNRWYYIAVARPHEAISPIINELGVETRNGTLISHYITAPDAAGLATKYTKTSLEYLVIRWRYELSLLINATIDVPSTSEEGWYLVITLADGTQITTALVAPRAGSATVLSLLAQVSSGAYGTIDVQSNYTITSATADGTPATIALTEVD